MRIHCLSIAIILKLNKLKKLFTFLSNTYFNRKHFFDSLFLGSVSAIVSQGFNFIVTILIARQLGSVAMGQFALIQSIVMLLITFGILGQNVSATALTSRFVKRYPNQLGNLIGNSYLVSFFSTFATVVVSIVVAKSIFSELYLSNLPRSISLMLCLVWFVAMTFDMMQASVLIGMQAYKDLVKTDVLKGLFALSIIYPLALKYGLVGALVGYAGVYSMGLAINQWFIRKNLKKLNTSLNFKLNPKLIKTILGFGLPIFIAALFMSPTNWFTNKIVFNSTNGPIALGILFVCRQLLVLIQFFPTQISRVLLPIIAVNSKSQEEMKVKKIGLWLSFLICLGLVLLFFIFEQFVFEVYRLDPQMARWPFRVVLLAALFSNNNLIMGQFIVAQNRPWIRTIADAVIAIIMIITTLILVKSNSFIAIPVAILVSFVASNILLFYFLKKETQSNKHKIKLVQDE